MRYLRDIRCLVLLHILCIRERERERTSPEFCQISSLDFSTSSVSSVSRGAGALIADCIVIGLQPWFKGVITAGNRAQFPPIEHSWTPGEDWTGGRLLGAHIVVKTLLQLLLPLVSVSLFNEGYCCGLWRGLLQCMNLTKLTLCIFNGVLLVNNDWLHINAKHAVRVAGLVIHSISSETFLLSLHALVMFLFPLIHRKETDLSPHLWILACILFKASRASLVVRGREEVPRAHELWGLWNQALPWIKLRWGLCSIAPFDWSW